MGSDAGVRQALGLSERGKAELTHSIELLELFMYKIMREGRRKRMRKGSGEVFMEERVGSEVQNT